MLATKKRVIARRLKLIKVVVLANQKLFDVKCFMVNQKQTRKSCHIFLILDSTNVQREITSNNKIRKKEFKILNTNTTPVSTNFNNVRVEKWRNPRSIKPYKCIASYR